MNCVDDIRLEQFLQLKKEIRGSEKHLIVGIDAAKEIKCGHMVVLVGGVAVKNNRQLLDGRWDKHDVKDAANVADLIAQGKCLFYEYPPMTLRNVRILIALKRRLKRREHGISVCMEHYRPDLTGVRAGHAEPGFRQPLRFGIRTCLPSGHLQ